MRNPDRLDGFFDEFKYLYKKNFPDWRFFQLIINFANYIGKDPWNLEDDHTLYLFRRFCEDYNNGFNKKV